MAKEIQYLKFWLLLLSVWEPCLSIPSDRPSGFWATLNFQAGDILLCHVNFLATQTLLATSSSDVAYLERNKLNGKGILREESLTSYNNRDNSSLKFCEILEKATLPDAVVRARRDIRGYGGREIYYDPLFCNSEHWVKDWAHGAQYSDQSLEYPNSNCDVGKRNYAGAENRSTVTIYQNSDGNLVGAGSVTTVSVGPGECFSWNADSWWNDRATQVILKNKCIRVWSDSDCQGHSNCFCEDKKDLSYEMMDSGRNWDNEITSLSMCSFRGELETGIEVYEHMSYKGRDRKIVLQDKECLTFFRGDWWNDRISSIEVKFGCVEYFNDPYCRGRSYRLSQNEHYVGDVYNDDISSLRPC